MGRARAFTAKVVMLRSKPTGQVGTIGIGGPGHWRLLCRRIQLRSNCLYERVRTIKIGEFMEPSKKESFHGNLRFRFVGGLAVCSAVTSLFFLISSPSAFAGGQKGFSIKVFTSPDDQFWANS